MNSRDVGVLDFSDALAVLRALDAARGDSLPHGDSAAHIVDGTTAARAASPPSRDTASPPSRDTASPPSRIEAASPPSRIEAASPPSRNEDAATSRLLRSPWFWGGIAAVLAVGVTVLVLSQTADGSPDRVTLQGRIAP
ncbi:MAG: hypothetical protein EXR75_00765 [Myxococcales bacterium]|nr:hypothetical protein [Myxococcales bacterium]